MSSEQRAVLLDLYRSALAAVDGRRCVALSLNQRSSPAPVYAVAIGKAAGSMMLGAFDAWSETIERALVITKSGHGPHGLLSDSRVQLIEAGHPLPNARSLEAGNALLEFIDAAPEGAELLFLVSGGASSLVEVLPAGVTLAQWHRANEWLLSSGLDIRHTNAVRKALSCIKGGRLALRLQGHGARALMISDVRGDDPATIGSGLLVAPVDDPPLATMQLPDWLRTLIDAAPPLLPSSELASLGVRVDIVARLDDAVQAAARTARDAGWAVSVHPEFVEGEAADAGVRLAEAVRDGAAGVHIWGGETTVRLPPEPGRGGRSQQLALSAARVLAGHAEVALLAAGTDGTDGPGGDAGALVDGGTIARGATEGLDAADCLRRADAGTFLEASGDLVHTGPTGTNVMDLVIALKAV